MPDVQPLATSLMPQYEAPADRMLKLGELGYANTQRQIAQMNAQQTALRAQAQQTNQQLLAAAQNPAATPDATNTTPAQMQAAAIPGTGPNPLINRTGAPVNGTPSLGSVGTGSAAMPGATGAPAPAPAPDMSPAGIRQRYFALASSKGVPADIIDSTLKMFDQNTAGQQEQIKLDQASRDARDRDVTDQSFADANGDPDATVNLMLKRGASPSAVSGFQNKILATKTSIATLSKDQLDTAIKGHDQERGSLLSFVSNPSMLDKMNGWDDLKAGWLRSGYITQAELDALPVNYPGDDAATRIANGQAAASQLMKEEQERRTGNQKDTELGIQQQNADRAATPKTAAELAVMANDPNATDAQRTQAKGALKDMAAQAQASRPVTNVTTGPGALTQDDFARAGEEYARTGKMPSLGMNGGSARTQVLHYANEFARTNGLSPADIVTMQAAYRGDAASLAKLQAQRDQVVSFERTASANLDQFLNAAARIPDWKMPWINTPLRLINQQMGGVDMAVVNAARAVATNEIAKVTSGGGLSGVVSDSTRKEVKDYNPQNATLAQTVGVAKALRQDMANRHASLDETLADIRARLGGGANAPAAAAPATGTTNTGVTVVDPRGISHMFPTQAQADKFKQQAGIP